jgi:hypothetical protein
MKIKIFCNSSPENPATGYPDTLLLVDKANQVLDVRHCRTAPNPFRPSDSKPWEQAYGWLAIGTYTWTVYMSDKFGKCLLINDGGICRSRTPNVNHNGQLILKRILFHEGGFKCKNPDWPGSAGCMTMHRKQWYDFINHFHPEDHGELEIVDGPGKGEYMGLLGRFKLGKGVWKAFKTSLGAGLVTAATTALVPIAGPEMAETAVDALASAAAAPAVEGGGPDIPISAFVTVGTFLLKLVAGWLKHRKG